MNQKEQDKYDEWLESCVSGFLDPHRNSIITTDNPKEFNKRLKELYNMKALFLYDTEESSFQVFQFKQLNKQESKGEIT